MARFSHDGRIKSYRIEVHYQLVEKVEKEARREAITCVILRSLC